jgi:acyl-CoA synthetase (AMP-forming)/AMP-acid ligase II
MNASAMASFRNLGDLIRRDRDLAKVAIIDLSGESGVRQFTYAELDGMANAVARALSMRGLERGERVAILSANRAEYLAAYFGIMRAGLVAVPVNFKFPRPTIHFIMRDAGVKLVFCDPARAPDCPRDIPCIQFGAGGESAFGGFLDPGPFVALVPAADEPAMFLYTSGSTGPPKGVVLSHQGHIWVVETRLDGRDLSHHRFLIAAPLYHMNALALSKLACAAHATIVMLPQFSASAYIAAIGRYRCTWLTAVPPMIAMMLRESDLLARTDLSSVELIRMGSAPVSQSLMRALRQRLPHAGITNAYGTTEAGPVVFGPHPDALPQPDLSVGYPHPGVQLRLVAPDDRNAEQGVLEMRCPAVMLGYHNRPELPVPITSDGYYITGDVFRRDAEGFHYFVGRADDMFVSGGENIYPADVERMLERHPDIAQASVVPIDDDIKGQKPVAFIALKAGRKLAEDDVKRFALANAPAYQHPRFVWFIDELPLASTNKIDRAALRRIAAERVAELHFRRENAGRVEVDRQLPVGDEIFLDHVGHFVPDPAAAARALARAGFSPTPASIQVGPDGAPTGTGNLTAMFARGYVEVLFKSADTPLGRELDVALASHAGVHLAAFSVADAGSAHRRLAAAGFRVRPLAEMRRPVDTEQGSDVAAFTVARVEPGVMAEGRVQILTHRTEHAVWQRRWLMHRNGSFGLDALVIVVASLPEAAERFVRFTARPALASRLGRTIRLDRGRVELVTADAFTALLPEVRIPRLPFMGAYGLFVPSLDETDSVLRACGLRPRRLGAALASRFPAELGEGAWLFAEAAADFPWPCG